MVLFAFFQKNHERALKMTTRTTLIEIWRYMHLPKLVIGTTEHYFRGKFWT